MYDQDKKPFLRPICSSGDITYISIFSSKKISLNWEIFKPISGIFFKKYFFKEISKLSAKENPF